MKVKGLGRSFGSVFGYRIGRGCFSEAADRLLWARFRLDGGRPHDSDGFWVRGVGAGGCGRAAGRRVPVVGCGWARVDDVSKRRRQGLVVCRATGPFEGLIYARPGVTLAPTFAGLLACQSRTIRV